MSYYDIQSLQSPSRSSWDQPPPSRSGATSTMQNEETTAFSLQIEEVERAIDNLAKSGKLYNMPGRRDSIPMMGGPRMYSDYEPRMAGMSQRHQSMSEFDPMRSNSGSNLQSYYAAQRYHQPRHSEAEQMQQARRRMAAQRERELRNYHQEQQYNRKISIQSKPDPSLSPTTMTEEDHRQPLPRQHRPLYDPTPTSFYDPTTSFPPTHDSTPRPPTQPTTSSTTGRNPSPLAYSATFPQHQPPTFPSQPDTTITTDAPLAPHKNPSPRPRSRANSTASPASNTAHSFTLFENPTAHQSSRTSTSSPGTSPPRPLHVKTAATAPIGTRPTVGAQAQIAVAGGKRTGTPSGGDVGAGVGVGVGVKEGVSVGVGAGMGWGSGSGVWGKTPLGVQASVWG